MEKIRVNRGIVVEVNDEGETIRINAEDQMFVNQFYDLIERLEKTQKDMEEHKDKEEREQLSIMIEKTRDIMDEIDGMFGAGACAKVFGDIVPSVYLIVDFFDQLIPIVTAYADDRQKQIESKYNRYRKGSRKK